MDSMQLRRRQTGIGVVTAASILYGILFVLLYPSIGQLGSQLALLPVLAIGWLFGMQAGLLAGLIVFPVNVLLLNLVGAPGVEIMFGQGLIPYAVSPLVGGVIGRLHDESQRLQQELATRIHVDATTQASEERYRRMTELISDYAFSMKVGADGTLNYEWISDNVSRVLGYSIEELNAGRLLPIHPDDQPGAQTQIEQVLQGHNAHGEARILTKNGELRWVHIYRHPVWDAGKKRIERYYGIVQDITVLRQAEQELRNSEMRFRTFVDHATDAFFLHYTQGKVLDVNRQACQSLGYTREELIGMAPKMFDPNATPEFMALLNTRLRNGETVSFDTYHQRKDGSTFPVEVRIRPFTDHGQWATVSLVRDITERKQKEAALRRQNEYLTALHETTLAIMNRFDTTELLNTILSRAVALVGTDYGSVSLFSPDKTQLIVSIYTGYSDELLLRGVEIGKGLRGMVWQTGQTVVVNDYQNWEHRSEGTIPTQIRANIGIPLKINEEMIGILCVDYHEVGRTFSDEDEAILTRFAGLASIALDNARLYNAARQELAVRKQAEEDLRRLNVELEQRVTERTAELRYERTLLQTILDAMGEGLIYIVDNRIRYVNNAAAALSGYEIEELTGQINTILMGEQRLEEEARILQGQTLTPRNIWRTTTRFARKDGSTFDAALTMTLVADDTTQGIVAIVRDVTAEKQLQAQKARFIANASHELRTPITNFKTRLYLLSQQPELLDKHLDVLRRTANQMASLVEDLLDTSRFERGVMSLQLQDVILQTLIVDTVETQQLEAAAKHINLSYDLPAEPMHIQLDANRMMQVLINLVTNGINYTPEHGQVTLELGTEGSAAELFAAVRVRDTGIGIAPEHLPRLFEPFFRADEGSVRGTGLGLSISKEIVELHGGRLEIASKVGEGSTFSVLLPLAPKGTPSAVAENISSH